MAAGIEGVGVHLAGLEVVVDAVEQVLFAGLLHLVGASVVRVRVLHELLGLQIVVQVGVGQVLREVFHDLVLALPHIVPAALGVAVLAAGGGQRAHALEVAFRQKDLVLLDVGAQLGHQILAVVLDGGEPAEVVQAKVIVDDLLLVLDAHGSCHHVNDGNGHIADVDDPCLRAQLAAGFGYDGGGVGVVQDPVVLLGILFHVVDQLDHGEDGAHSVGHAAAAAGLLSHAAVAQRDLFVLFPHGVAAHAHLGKHKRGVRVSLLHIGGDHQLDVGIQLLVQDPVHHNGNLVLPLLVDVEQTDLVHFQFIPAQGDGFDDTGGKRATAASNGNDHSINAPFLYFQVCPAHSAGAR